MRRDGAAIAQLEMLHAVLALVVYRDANGGYPESLDALVPKRLDAAPIDPFSDKPVVYRREGEGYVLYSVGPDFNDDGGVDAGKLFADDPHDLVLRVGVDDDGEQR